METPLGCIWHNLNQGQFHAAVQIHRRIRRPRPPHPQHHPQKPRRHRFPHRPALPFDVKGLKVHPLYDEPFQVIVPKGHPWAKRKKIASHEVRGENVLVLK
ncbi:MAG TPA: LysR substrate-binding domain-containing protein, partial [Planctomycetaceae bacterium]|nr:LysR substrate-binding domain-containing protein [Planctomycetaceae bacterium]